MNKKEIINKSFEVLDLEAKSILDLKDKIDEQIVEAVNLVYKNDSRIIVTGIGKSGLVGKKMVATFNSTGSRSVFLHPVEAMHGDLGLVSKKDVFFALSNSGETDEVILLVEEVKKFGCKVVAFTGNLDSKLAKISDFSIYVGVEKEACPLGLAPTCSTTALLAMGDVFSVLLTELKAFKRQDFKKFHPAGSLGQRLALEIQDIMIEDSKTPKAFWNNNLYECVKIINEYHLGVVFVTDQDMFLKGVVTDGDIRRFVAQNIDFKKTIVKDIMSADPKFLSFGTKAYDALNIMEKHQITALPVLDVNKKITGMIHLHDILGRGVLRFERIR